MWKGSLLTLRNNKLSNTLYSDVEEQNNSFQLFHLDNRTVISLYKTLQVHEHHSVSQSLLHRSKGKYYLQEYSDFTCNITSQFSTLN